MLTFYEFGDANSGAENRDSLSELRDFWSLLVCKIESKMRPRE